MVKPKYNKTERQNMELTLRLQKISEYKQNLRNLPKKSKYLGLRYHYEQKINRIEIYI